MINSWKNRKLKSLIATDLSRLSIENEKPMTSEPALIAEKRNQKWSQNVVN